MANFKLDANAKYAKTHEWVRIEEGVAFVGITDAAQDMLSDVVYVELPEEGAEIAAGKQADLIVVRTAALNLTPLNNPIGALVLATHPSDVESVLVSEEEIEEAFRFVYARTKLACEPAGAVGVAAVLAGKVGGTAVGIVVSGGNVAAETASAILARR